MPIKQQNKAETPSFFVNPAKNIYKCFGCGKGGNTIEFIKEDEGVDFKDAVEIGAKKLNIPFQWKKAQALMNEITSIKKVLQ